MMADVNTLPIPDLGLRCPHCGEPVAGLYDYRCDRCLRRFSMVAVLATHRPLVDLGLTCPVCGYSLTGLPEERCPECGNEFSPREMLAVRHRIGSLYSVLSRDDPPDHHQQRRAPRLTGRERPLPDFGLECRACGRPLAGAEADACLHCGAGFEVDAYVPAGELADISLMVPWYVWPRARMILYGDQVPYLCRGATGEGGHMALRDLYGVEYSSGVRLLVPRAFFFDAMHALMAAMPARRASAEEWRCGACGEMVPGDFDVCWNCEGERGEGKSREGLSSPDRPLELDG